jgi:alpha-beta hydrolase superfamily lysophospholipase
MPDAAFRLISAADGASLQAYAWRGPQRPIGVVVIAHGAAEHALRYERFARALGAAGFVTFALDHRGHGQSPGPAGLGDFGRAGWDGLVADVGQLVDYARAAHARLPLALFGHSMGSFAAAQLAFERSAAFDALVLSGSTALEPGVELDLNFNAAFEPARTRTTAVARSGRGRPVRRIGCAASRARASARSRPRCSRACSSIPRRRAACARTCRCCSSRATPTR